MIILPSLTSTKKDKIGAFLEAMGRTGVRTIALFPTTLKPDERKGLYADLERVGDVRIPHVHLRSDCTDEEIDYLADRFHTEVFNVHPANSGTAYVPEGSRWLKHIYLENSDALPEEDQLEAYGGICPDFAHWEAARRAHDPEYEGFADLVRRFPARCCHISAIREGDPNPWNGRTDHHHFTTLADFDYLDRYKEFFPPNWASLEVENPLEEQLEVVALLKIRLGLP